MGWFFGDLDEGDWAGSSSRPKSYIRNINEEDSLSGNSYSVGETNDWVNVEDGISMTIFNTKEGQQLTLSFAGEFPARPVKCFDGSRALKKLGITTDSIITPDDDGVKLIKKIVRLGYIPVICYVWETGRYYVRIAQ